MLSLFAISYTLVCSTSSRGGIGKSCDAMIGRRQLLQSCVAVLPFAVFPENAVASQGINIDDSTKVAIIKAKALREMVRRRAQQRRSMPMDVTTAANNYKSLSMEVLKQRDALLLPLQAKLTDIAAKAVLPDEQKQQLALQPLLLKGHLLELDQALTESKFDVYVSKTTKSTYLGGKVERELEEVCETLDDFLAIAAGKTVDMRSD